jgi:hypothetical protein
MNAKRASPGVNVKFLEIVQKRFIQFCYKFKNLAERAEAFGVLAFFVTFFGNEKKLRRRKNMILNSAPYD